MRTGGRRRGSAPEGRGRVRSPREVAGRGGDDSTTERRARNEIWWGERSWGTGGREGRGVGRGAGMTSARADAPPPARDVLAGVRLGEGGSRARRRPAPRQPPRIPEAGSRPPRASPRRRRGWEGGITHRGGACASRGGDIARTRARARGMAERRRRCGFARAGKPSANAFRSGLFAARRGRLRTRRKSVLTLQRRRSSSRWARASSSRARSPRRVPGAARPVSRTRPCSWARRPSPRHPAPLPRRGTRASLTEYSAHSGTP